MKKVYVAPTVVVNGSAQRDTKGGMSLWLEDGSFGWPEPGNVGFHL